MDRLYRIIERDGLGGLTEAEAGLFGIYWFVAETNNGGVDQFFFNDSGQLAMHALRYLEQIGATKTASILSACYRVVPRRKRADQSKGAARAAGKHGGTGHLVRIADE